jgi:urease accessory protein
MSADVPVITGTHVHVELGALDALEEDAIVLTAEERRWGRRRVRTRAGRELQLALPTGSQLARGAILFVGPGFYVRVEAAPEPVLAVRPSTFEDAVRIAFEVGNRHFTIAIDDDRLLVPADPAMEQLLARLGLAFDKVDAPFEPVGSAHRHVQGHE